MTEEKILKLTTPFDREITIAGIGVVALQGIGPLRVLVIFSE